MGWSIGLILAVAIALLGCDTDQAPAADTATETGSDLPAQDLAELDPSGDNDLEEMSTEADLLVDTGMPPADPDCDPLMPVECSMPWPSSLYLVADDSRQTGFTLRFGETTLPENNLDERADPAPYERMDGYGVGSFVVVLFPNLDTSTLAPESDIASSLEEGAQVVILEVDDDGDTRRIPYWAEPDGKAPDPAFATLMVRPAIILDEETRYIVAFRGLLDLEGEPIPPSAAFAHLRDGDTADIPELAPRQGRFDEVFAFLEAEGIGKEELTLAWDFTTASSAAIHGPMLHMYETAFDVTGDDGPELSIDDVVEYTVEQNAYVALRIRGTFDAPFYMEEARHRDKTGYVFHYGADGMPAQNGSREASFEVLIPHSAMDGTPHGLVQYGHGLLGGSGQMFGPHNGRIANDHHLIFFGGNLTGMSEDDVDSAIGTAANIGQFPWLADYLHQGILEYLLLGRSAFRRLSTEPEITDRGIVINDDERYYSGISQGGIFGATYMALSEDVTRGHLGVAGNNYTLLLERSVDFQPYFAIAALSYRQRHQQAILLSAVGQLWEGTDPVSYLRHVAAEPFPGLSPHQVLIAIAKADPEVPVLSNEILARSELDIPLMEHFGHDVFDAVEAAYPRSGSGIVLYDFGDDWPAPGNHPPEHSETGNPHDKPKHEAHHSEQMVTFFRTGEIIDVCGGDGCTPE